ncbi:YciI family protein [Aeromonas simiae]|uniref:YciI family protein n=1 Tax=Aeromonas simiae TaxID=218936 RepID=UPI00266CFFD6|nr:YciI family protein [Aeromonas simiae]MDO2947719.1 YciI family protein [Aeromonas simiae]MDO2952339.1 YciI family protein [Aeromonas simiae]MDO2954934.1 YciI family protein [Aeromonas simiae]
MFVVTLTYVRALTEIDALIPAHVEWLKAHYAAGHFLASGRRVPRTGGVILAHGLTREALELVLASDPFRLAGVADYEVLEFVPSMTTAGLEAWQER